jgi:hypothetical protein
MHNEQPQTLDLSFQRLTLLNLPRLEQGLFHGNGTLEVVCSDCVRLNHLDFVCHHLTNLDFVRSVPSLQSINLSSNRNVPIAKEHLEHEGKSWRNCIGEVREYLAGRQV